MIKAKTRLFGMAGWAKKLSLDAPLVAVTWVEILRRGYGSEHETPPSTVAALVFATVWCIYMFDRLMDVRTLRHDRPVSERHRFAKRYKHFLWPIWMCVAALTVGAAFTWMDDGLRNTGLIHLAWVAFYFLFVHGPLMTRFQLPKEALVGVLFAFGVCMTVAPPWTPSFLPGVALLSALFSLNCLIVAQGDHAIDSLQQTPSVVRKWQWVRERLAFLGLWIALVSVLLIFVTDLPKLVCVSACASACMSSFLCHAPIPGRVNANTETELSEGQLNDWRGSLADAILVGVPLVVALSWPALGFAAS